MITDDDKRAFYLLTHCRLLGKGSGRVVYDTGKGYVVKLSISKFGDDETKQEIKISRCIQRHGSRSLVPFLVCDKDAKWIVSKKVEPLKSMEQLSRLIDSMCGLTENEFADLVSSAYANGDPTTDPDIIHAKLVDKHKDLYTRNEWYRSVIDAAVHCDLDLIDLYYTYENWGVDPAGNLVMIDVGFRT